MKRPKCMEKWILDDVPVVDLCPKCGSEMTERDVLTNVFGYEPRVVRMRVCKCGHDEKVK